jgi:hypothetical protein
MTDSYELPRSSYLLDRWGHLAPQFLNVAIAIVIMLGIWPMAPSPSLLLVALTLFAFVIVTWLLMREHDRRLCEWCAAAMPLNAAELASKYGRRFWVVHSGSNPRFLVPYLVVLLGSNVLPGPIGRIVWALVQSTMMYLIVATATHRRLQPWCPWCRGGDGGIDAPAEPDVPRGNNRQPV